jgi:hypothetical protein
VRVLWWSGLTIIVLGIVRTVGFAVRGIVTYDTTTLVLNLVFLPIEGVFVWVLWRVRGQVQPPGDPFPGGRR